MRPRLGERDVVFTKRHRRLCEQRGHLETAVVMRVGPRRLHSCARCGAVWWTQGEGAPALQVSESERRRLVDGEWDVAEAAR